ncbi:MAG: hypothetical protein HC844_01690 [Tabrizicola sp.]|nr:hypothetical protein [Tabrizicola sp.]
MGYASGHPIRLISGRLALDFVNTADWSSVGEVTHEKLASLADLGSWAKAVGLSRTMLPDDIGEAVAYRRALRRLFLPASHAVDKCAADPFPHRGLLLDGTARPPTHPPLLDMIATSALALLSDPREMDRIKLCPGDDCGWLFLDETRNARRKWCMMETCGNRAKAARHYAKSRAG